MKHHSLKRTLSALFAAALIACTAAVTAYADPGQPNWSDDTSSETAYSAADAGVTDYNSGSESSEADVPTVPETALTAPKLNVKTSRNAIRITWKKVDGAEKYYVYKQQPSGSYKKLGYTGKLTFTDKNLAEGSTQSYRISAVRGSEKKTSRVTAETSRMRILLLQKSTPAYKSVGGSSFVSLRPGYYTGYTDTINYDGYCVIYARGIRCLVKKSAVKGVGGKYKALSCSSISQLDGNYYKGYACGPGAVTIMFDAVSGKNISVETVIRVAQEYGVTVYSDYSFMSDGMPCKGIKELLRALISKYNISGKTVHVTNTSSYSSASALAKAFKKHIDQGHRVLVCLTEDSYFTSSGTKMTYTSNVNDPTHYVVITGYTVSGGKTYFFTGDSWYANKSAHDYAAKNNNRNRTAARYYYGLICTEGNALARSVFTAAKVSKSLAQIIYI